MTLVRTLAARDLLRARLSAGSRAAFALAVTLLFAAAIFAAAGADPLLAYEALVEGSLGNQLGVTETLMLTSILTLVALAFAIPARARLWNIGGEGQMFVGALASVTVALKVQGLAPAVLTVMSMLAGGLAGSAWASLAGALKVLTGAHEVLTTLMLNFVAILLADYAIANTFASAGIPSATPVVPEGVALPTVWAGTGVNLGLVVALLAVISAQIVLASTTLGLRIRATGFNVDGARNNGVAVERVQVVSLALGGAFAGLAGAVVVIGIEGLLSRDFSPGYGFIGIAIALLARSRPLWIVPAALLFAALTVGGSYLEPTVGLSSSAALLVQAVLVLMLLATWALPPDRRAGQGA